MDRSHHNSYLLRSIQIVDDRVVFLDTHAFYFRLVVITNLANLHTCCLQEIPPEIRVKTRSTAATNSKSDLIDDNDEREVLKM